MLEFPAAKRNNPRSRIQSGDGPTEKERDYLEIIYYMSQREGPVIAADLGRWLGVQPSTVSHALQQLEEKHYIARDERNAITLMPEGFELAETIVQRQRLIECFLSEVLKVPWHLVHEEAVRMEHVLSPVVAERVAALVGDIVTCPHGNPIPGYGALQANLVRLDTVEVGKLFTIRRIAEEAEEQTELLRYLEINGLIPGHEFFIPDASPVYGTTLRRCNHNITIPSDLSGLLWGEAAAIG
jgi:DtxR family Mn-dependent transcriptional regulator